MGAFYVHVVFPFSFIHVTSLLFISVVLFSSLFYHSQRLLGGSWRPFLVNISAIPSTRPPHPWPPLHRPPTLSRAEKTPPPSCSARRVASQHSLSLVLSYPRYCALLRHVTVYNHASGDLMALTHARTKCAVSPTVCVIHLIQQNLSWRLTPSRPHRARTRTICAISSRAPPTEDRGRRHVFFALFLSQRFVDSYFLSSLHISQIFLVVVAERESLCVSISPLPHTS